MKQHKVQLGECMSSIAEQYGLSVDTIWNLGDNSSLKEKRKDPNMLVPGDVVAIPDRKEKIAQCETEKIHKFKLKAGSTILRLQLFEDEKAFASKSFELKVEGKTIKGSTDADGLLEVTIPPKAVYGVLTITDPHRVFHLHFGYLRPVDEKEGVDARLENLGFTEGSSKDRIRAFQKRFGLDASGEADQATKDKLVEIHDAVCAFPEEAAEEDSAAGGDSAQA